MPAPEPAAVVTSLASGDVATVVPVVKVLARALPIVSLFVKSVRSSFFPNARLAS